MLGTIMINSGLELNAEAIDPKVELNTYIDPIKDLGIKPLSVTIKFDNDQLADDINNIVAETPNVEVKEVKKNARTLKTVKRQNRKVTTENNARADEVVLGASNLQEVEKIAKKSNRRIKNIKQLSDVDNTTKRNKDIEVTDLTPLMNSLYPSRQTINAINSEILAEAKFEKEHLKKMRNVRNLVAEAQELKKVVTNGITNGVTVQADSNTSAELHSLVIYSRMNQGLTLDVPNSNFARGTPLQLWDRWTNFNPSQNFKTNVNNPSISVSGRPNLCLHRRDNSYNNGTPVILWDCNNAEASQWQTHSDGTIRPLRNNRKCLDAVSGLNRGSRIVVHDCHGRDNQNFRMGYNEEFGSTRTYRMSIHAVGSDLLKEASFKKFGHALISVSRDVRITNTFGLNGESEYRKDKNQYQNTHFLTNSVNNIHTWNAINIDSKLDWLAANQWPEKPGDPIYRKRSVAIPKTTYDTIKYMRGWDFDPKYRVYHIIGRNCANYARDFWNTYVNFSSNNARMKTISPSQIVDFIEREGSIGY